MNRKTLISSLVIVLLITAVFVAIQNRRHLIFAPDIKEIEVWSSLTRRSDEQPDIVMIELNFRNNSRYSILIDKVRENSKIRLNNVVYTPIVPPRDNPPNKILPEMDTINRIYFKLPNSADREFINLVIDGAAVGATKGKFLLVLETNQTNKTTATYLP